MNKYMSLLFLPAMMLTACQTQLETVQVPQAVFNTKVITIENSQLNQYWLLEQIKPVMLNKRPYQEVQVRANIILRLTQTVTKSVKSLLARSQIAG